MKILQLSKKIPFPFRDGEAIAVHGLTTAMHAKECEYTLLVMSTPKHPADVSKLPADYTHYQAIHTVAVDTDVKLIDAFLNLFTQQSYNISRFDNAGFRKKLIELLQKNDYDIVQLETLFLTPYIATIREYSTAKIVLRAHNVEYEIWERMAQNESFLPKKYYLKLLATRLKRYEIAQLNRTDLIVGITDRDNQYYRDLGCKISMMVAPSPANLSFQPPVISQKTMGKIGFLGSLDWLPNQEGIAWFVKEVWGDLQAKYSTWTLNVAGRNTPKELMTRWSHVRVVGEVPDAQEFVLSNDVMIVPILSGSGMRIKIIEAMALGKVVVTTTIGAEGIHGVHNRDFMLADTPAEFAACLERCFTDADLFHTIQINAASFVKKHFDAEVIAQNVIESYRKLL